MEKSLLEIKTRKSCGHDLLPPRLLTESASVISEPLTKNYELFNQSRSLYMYYTLQNGASDPIM